MSARDLEKVRIGMSGRVEGKVAIITGGASGIGEGTVVCPDLLGDVVIDKVRPEDAYGHILPGTRLMLKQTFRIVPLKSQINTVNEHETCR